MEGFSPLLCPPTLLLGAILLVVVG